MAFIAASRVLETFTTTGTGTITLGGALVGYRTFASALSNADTCFYFMEGGSDYEIGYGTYSAGTLARTTVLKSSNANAAVNWASGTKTVGIAPLGPSDLDATNLDRLLGVLGIAAGKYTPTFTGVANIDAAVGSKGHYIRVRNAVFCAVYGTIDATAAASTLTTMRISIPVASNFANVQDLSGVASIGSNVNGQVRANTANDVAELNYFSGSTSNQSFSATFGYEVI